MDQRDWGLLRETVVRRTQAAGASREDAEDATHDALLAAIGEPEHPRSQVAWVSTVAQRRRVDLIRQRVRQERVSDAAPAGADPTAAGPEDQVVDRAHATWLAASLTQLPPTTREVVDAVGAGMTPAEVARSMNLSARSVESHLTRARRHLRRLGALGLPMGALLDWSWRARAGNKLVTTTVAVTVPAAVAAVTLLPSSSPMGEPGASPAPPAVTATTQPGPHGGGTGSGPAATGPGAGPAGAGTSSGRSAPGAAGTGSGLPVAEVEPRTLPQPGSEPAAPDPADLPSAPGADGAAGTGEAPTGRSLPPQQCPLPLVVVGDLGCVLVDLVGGVAGGAPPAPGSVSPAPGP